MSVSSVANRVAGVPPAKAVRLATLGVLTCGMGGFLGWAVTVPEGGLAAAIALAVVAVTAVGFVCGRQSVVIPVLAACAMGGLLGWALTVPQGGVAAVIAVAVIAVMAAGFIWGLEGLVITVLVGSLLPLPAASVGTAHFPLATFAAPLILAAGVWIGRRRRVPLQVPLVPVYVAFLVVAALSVATSWVFWDLSVPTGMERGYGHRQISYQLTALYLLAFPFLAFAAGVVISRLIRIERLYACVFLAMLALTLVVIATWLQHPLNPVEAFATGDRTKINNQWAAYLVVLATVLAVQARTTALRLVAVVALCVGLAATVISYVLSAWVGIIAAATVIMWHRFRARGLLVWLGLLFIAALVMQSTLAAIVTQRALSPDADRVGLWKSTLTIWSTSPLVGVGPGNLASYMETYSAFPLGLVLQGYQQAHNMFLELLAENGILGVALLAVFLFVVIRTLARAGYGTPAESFGIAAGLGVLVASAGIAAFSSGFIPTIASAGYNALPMVFAVWFLVGCGVGLAKTANGPGHLCLPVIADENTHVEA